MSEAANERSGVLMSIRGVTKAFGSNVVLKGINMDVKKGEVIALIGGNGAGKSTLMKIIMGIYDLDEGEIFMAGQPVKLGKGVLQKATSAARPFCEQIKRRTAA